MRLSLNIYALAHAAGIYNPDGTTPYFQHAEDFLPLVRQTGFSSLELPLDYFFDDLSDDKFQDFITAATNAGIHIFPALEHYNPDYLCSNLAAMAAQGWTTIRIKMPHLGDTFYGGNRHLSDHFSTSLASFKTSLDGIESDLADAGVKIAIENHQDLDAYDLLDLCETAAHGMRRITWDIGNSLSTLHTPDQFIRIASQYIANIHFKDYQVVNMPEGIALRRTILGEGFIPLNHTAEQITALPQCENISMELAAHPDRICRICDQAYYHPQTMTPDDKKTFDQFVQSVMTENKAPLSLHGESLTKLEIEQTLTSCNVLKSLFI